MFKENKKKTSEIDKTSKSIERLNGKIKHMKLKITQHSIECSKRNQDLKKEKENILKNYQELKAKMLKFREDEVNSHELTHSYACMFSINVSLNSQPTAETRY